MKISEKMIPNPLCLKEEQTAFTAKELMLLNEIECLYVVDDKKRPIGAVSTVAASSESSRTKVKKLMSTSIITLHADQSIQDAALIFAKKDYNRVNIPVVDDDGTLVGVIRMRELIGVLSEQPGLAFRGRKLGLTAERAAVQLAMSRPGEEELTIMKTLREEVEEVGVTQVGANAEKLAIKMREAAVVAAIAHGVIKEDTMEKVAVTNAIRDIINQLEMVSPGLGGGYKLGIVRNLGRVSICAFGRCGHALANSSEHIFLGTAVV